MTHESETKQTISRSLSELVAQLVRELDRLTLDHKPANSQVVGANVTRSCRAIAILNLPSGSSLLLVCRTLARIEYLMLGRASLIANRRRQLGRPHPQICGAGVEVKSKLLRWCTDADCGEVLGVTLNIFGLIDCQRVGNSMESMLPTNRNISSTTASSFLDEGSRRRLDFAPKHPPKLVQDR